MNCFSSTSSRTYLRRQVRRVALALISVTRAVIVDVAFLLDLADHCTAALGASDQPGECEVTCHAAVLLSQPAVHHILHPLPEFDGNNRLVAALKQLAVPLELSAVEPVAEIAFTVLAGIFVPLLR